MEKKTRRIFLVSIQSNLLTENIEAYLKLQKTRKCRFITCGSVDDGNSLLLEDYFMTQKKF